MPVDTRPTSCVFVTWGTVSGYRSVIITLPLVDVPTTPFLCIAPSAVSTMERPKAAFVNSKNVAACLLKVYRAKKSVLFSDITGFVPRAMDASIC